MFGQLFARPFSAVKVLAINREDALTIENAPIYVKDIYERDLSSSGKLKGVKSVVFTKKAKEAFDALYKNGIT